MILRSFIISLLALVFCQDLKAQHPIIKEKGETYLSIVGLGNSILWERGTTAVLLVNDSVVHDIRYNKIMRRATVVSYEKTSYYSKEYAVPLSLAKYRCMKPVKDTIYREDISTSGRVFFQVINKDVLTKLIRRRVY